MNAAVVKTGRERPVSSRVLLETPRTKKSVLRAELVRWTPGSAPVVQLVVLVLGKNGSWFPAPGRAALRLDECRRVALALLEVSE